MDFCPIGLLPSELVPFPWTYELGIASRSQDPPSPANFAAKGMTVAGYGGGDSRVSRVKTLGNGGLFLAPSAVRPVGTKLTLLFEVPGGFVQAEAVVRNVLPGEGMGVESLNVGPQAQAHLDDLLRRLLQ